MFGLLLVAASVSREPSPSFREPERGRIIVGDILGTLKMLRQPRAIYPKEARRKHIQGVVELHALITKTGEVRDIVVVRGDPPLAPAALDAVKQWRHAPAILNSEPVEVRTTIDVNFTLSQ